MKKYSFDELVKIKKTFDNKYNQDKKEIVFIAPDNIKDYSLFMKQFYLSKAIPSQLDNNSFSKEKLIGIKDLNLFHATKEDINNLSQQGIKFAIQSHLTNYIKHLNVDFSFEAAL